MMRNTDLALMIMQIASAEIGISELPGPENEQRILEYKQSTPLISHTPDEVPWCSSFVNWVLNKAGVIGTGNPMAKSFLNWGYTITGDPFPGCIVVLNRGSNKMYGHVGFFKYRRSPGGWVHVLGGNQSNQVKVSLYAESDVVSYRWIEEVKNEQSV